MTTRFALFLPSLMAGGVQRVMINLAHEFIAAGHSVDIVLVKAKGPFQSKLPAAVQLIDLDARHARSCLPALTRYLSHRKPDVLIAAQPHCNVVALCARRLGNRNTRVMTTEHASLTLNLTQESWYVRQFLPVLMRRFYRQADAIVAVSRGVADELSSVLGMDRAKIHVIYNPIVTSTIAQEASADLNHPWLAKGQPPVILSAGRFVAQKDFSTLLRAFARLRQRRVTRLIILGEGPKLAELETLATQLGIHTDVQFHPFTTNPFSFMARCAVFALSSAWEGLPNVLIEAMACGAQLVATDCPSGPREILDHGRCGRLVAVGDDRALATAIEQALDDPIPAERLRLRANEFSAIRVARQYLDLCHHLPRS